MRPDTPSTPTHAPVFIVGAQRSGTTLLRLMLNGHPSLHIPFELGFLVEHLDADGGTPNGEEFRTLLQLDRLFRATQQPLPSGATYADCVQELFPTPPPSHPEVRHCGGVVHDRFSELLRWWPNAKFIFLTRDPRDVARSVIRMGWAGNGWHGSDRWVTAVDEAHALQQQVDADNWHRVSYEKLVATPVEELQALCEFLQVPWNDGLLAYPDSTTYHYPSPEAAFRWKTNAPLNEVALVEARVGMRLALLGYDARLLQPPSINSLQLFFLRLQNRCARIQFRLRRYGTWNVLMGAWTARLGPQKAAHHFILKMQHIDDILVQ